MFRKGLTECIQRVNVACKQLTFFYFREDSRNRTLFLNNLIDDRTESSMSYTEFIQHIQRQMNG